MGGVRGSKQGVRGQVVESGGEPACECSKAVSDRGGVCWREEKKARQPELFGAGHDCG